MADHTPEPWSMHPNSTSVCVGPDGKDISFTSRMVAYIRDEAQDTANTERIIACVNACAGLSSAALNTGVIDVMRSTLQAAAEQMQFEAAVKVYAAHRGSISLREAERIVAGDMPSLVQRIRAVLASITEVPTERRQEAIIDRH